MLWSINVKHLYCRLMSHANIKRLPKIKKHLCLHDLKASFVLVFDSLECILRIGKQTLIDFYRNQGSIDQSFEMHPLFVHPWGALWVLKCEHWLLSTMILIMLPNGSPFCTDLVAALGCWKLFNYSSSYANTAPYL